MVCALGSAVAKFNILPLAPRSGLFCGQGCAQLFDGKSGEAADHEAIHVDLPNSASSCSLGRVDNSLKVLLQALSED